MISVLWSDAASLPPKRPSGGPPDAIPGFLIEQKKRDAHLRKITDRGCLQSGQRHMFEVYLVDSETGARGTKVREQDTTNQKNQHAAMQHPQTREIDLQKLIETEASIRQIHINAHCGTVILFMIHKFSKHMKTYIFNSWTLNTQTIDSLLDLPTKRPND